MIKMADKQKKENIFKRFFKGIASYFKATKSEVKKVTWPSKKQVINNTGIVIACIAIVGVVIFVLNFIFGGAFGFFTKNKPAVEDPTDVYEVSTEDTTNNIAE